MSSENRSEQKLERACLYCQLHFTNCPSTCIGFDGKDAKDSKRVRGLGTKVGLVTFLLILLRTHLQFFLSTQSYLQTLMFGLS